MNLNDIFSELLFTPDDELLDIPSDENVDLNITFFTSTNEGHAHIPFAQFTVLGFSSDVPGVEAAQNTLERFYVNGQDQAGDDSKDPARRRVRRHRGIGERGSVLRRQEAW